ncbi:hypothetical protein [Arsenicicoccus dermatophilus]|uniref:hypothetical protein n=1 Tax=Arsenicicoccus dermatophilus TaxID=1076331 RepID=UPI003917226A
MATEMQVYADELRGALVRLGVPLAQCEQIVAEVEAHVVDTGERPVEAFGPAGVYAAEHAGVAGAPQVSAGARPPRRRRVRWVLVAAVALVLLGVLVLPDVIPLIAGPECFGEGCDRNPLRPHLAELMWSGVVALVPLLIIGCLVWFRVRSRRARRAP